MHPISSIGAGANQVNQTQQKSQGAAKAVNDLGVSFGAVFEGIKETVKKGIQVVSDKNSSSQAAWNRDKLDIEKKREWKTDLEEAQDVLSKIAKIIEKHGEDQENKD